MRLPKKRQAEVLPKYFPVGTVYVVEGRSSELGRLSVSSRYILMPGGGRIDLLGRPAAVQADRPHGRRGFLRGATGIQQRRTGTATKKSAIAPKKFVVVAGTAA